MLFSLLCNRFSDWSEAFGSLNGVVGLISPVAEVSDPLNLLQNSFGRGYFNLWVFGEVLVGIGGLLIGAVLLNGFFVRRTAARKEKNPEQLFHNLVNRLELTKDELGLLREITAGARLRHPAMCLLSPGLLDWARATWAAEQGTGIVTADKRRRVDNLCVKLFDHVAPPAAGAAEQAEPSLSATPSV